MAGKGCIEEPDLPEAAFVGTPQEGYAPLHVDFADRSRSGNSLIHSWKWSFGDGKSVSKRNPSHVYDKPGRYDVGLTVSNADGSHHVERAGYITVHEPILHLERQVYGGEREYSPGDIIGITLRLEVNQSVSLSALALQEHLPPGWELFQYGSGGAPDLVHHRSEANRLEVIWYAPPALPLEFNYAMRVPENAFGPQRLTGEALYRADAGALQSNTARTQLTRRQ